MIHKDIIGRVSKPVRVKIEAHAVRRFAEAVGIPFNSEVPPTFVGIFMGGEIEGLNLFQDGMIHGEQKFTYYQPVSVGDHIVYTRRIKDVFQRNGKLGRMTYMIIETMGCNLMGDPVYKISTTVIIPERGSDK